jgi:hypothetical protein
MRQMIMLSSVWENYVHVRRTRPVLVGERASPFKQFAPNSCVSGLLKIDNEGRISLELDGYLMLDRAFRSRLDHIGLDRPGMNQTGS